MSKLWLKKALIFKTLKFFSFFSSSGHIASLFFGAGIVSGTPHPAVSFFCLLRKNSQQAIIELAKYRSNPEWICFKRAWSWLALLKALSNCLYAVRTENIKHAPFSSSQDWKLDRWHVRVAGYLWAMPAPPPCWGPWKGCTPHETPPDGVPSPSNTPEWGDEIPQEAPGTGRGRGVYSIKGRHHWEGCTQDLLYLVTRGPLYLHFHKKEGGRCPRFVSRWMRTHQSIKNA